MTPIEERRLKIIKRLAEAASVPGSELRAALAGITNDATLSRDLAAIKSGEIPAGDETPPSAEQLALGVQLSDDQKHDDATIDRHMVRLAVLVTRRLMPIAEARAVQGILMGRRFFFATIEAAKAARKGGKPIVAMQAPPLSVMGGGE